MSQYIDPTILLIGQAFSSLSYGRGMNILTRVGTKDQGSLLQEDSKEPLGK